MNFVIVDVKKQRKTYPNTSEIQDRFLSVEQYHVLARRVIGKWAPAHVKASMLCSEDAIDFVAHKIMMGDWGWDESKSNIKTYRGYCGRRAIQDYISVLNEYKGFLTNILDDQDIYEILEDTKSSNPEVKAITKEDRQENREEVGFLMNQLNPTQRKCIILNYIEDMEVPEIARTLKISREGVRKAIAKGVEKMRGFYE